MNKNTRLRTPHARHTTRPRILRPRNILRWIIVSLAVCTAAAIVCSIIPIISVHNGEAKVYTTITETPHRQVALLLGTSKLTKSGKINRYYYARMRAVAELYAHGKIRTILASGDNQFSSYNEPHAMQKTLLALGVKSQDIILDYAGFRTFDSIVRANKVFNIDNYIIITQRPHNIRALYIAQHFDYRAISYTADLPRDGPQIYFHIREALARIKAVLDIHILHTTPRFLGSAQQIEL